MDLIGLGESVTPRSWSMQFAIHCSGPGCAAGVTYNLPDGNFRLLGHGPISFFDRVRILPGSTASDPVG